MGNFNKLRPMLQLLKPYKGAVFGGLFCILVVTLVDLAFPLYFGRGVIDQALLGDGDIKLLVLLAFGVVVLMAIKGLFNFGQVYFAGYVGQRSLHNLRSRLFNHLLRLPVAYFDREGRSDIVSRATNDIAIIQNALSAGIADIIQQGLTLIGIIVLIVFLNWKLALVSLIVLPLVAWAVSTFGNRIRKQTHQLNDRIASLTTLLSESLAGIRVVKAFTMEASRGEKFTRENERGFQASMKSLKATATMRPIVEIIVVVGMVMIVLVGGIEVVEGRLSLGDLVAFMALAGMATHPVGLLTRSASLLQQAVAAGERVFAVLAEEPEASDAPGSRPLPRIRGHIAFRNVTFAYDREAGDVLKGINLEIQPGETVALVGPSGAGKSTLAALIPRFYQPTGGTIEIDGHDISQVTLESLRRQIGLVPQDTVLFAGTVRENILAGRSGYTDEDIERAARQAHAHEFIQQLPQGYDTVLGESGTSLSGGQRQRLAIARALLGDPRILIFDEATSNLDPESEQLIQEAFLRSKAGRTAVVIAHRAATIRLADRVVVLDQGRIVQDGRHAELIAVPGLYRRLFAEMETEADWAQEAVSG